MASHSERLDDLLGKLQQAGSTHFVRSTPKWHREPILRSALQILPLIFEIKQAHCFQRRLQANLELVVTSSPLSLSRAIRSGDACAGALESQVDTNLWRGYPLLVSKSFLSVPTSKPSNILRENVTCSTAPRVCEAGEPTEPWLKLWGDILPASATCAPHNVLINDSPAVDALPMNRAGSRKQEPIQKRGQVV